MSTALPDERLLAFSAYESARFGLRVFRGAVGGVDVDTLVRELENKRVDIAILRIASGASDLERALSDRGLHSIAADTLVHYCADLRAHAPAAPASDRLLLRRCNAGDALRLEAIVRETFDGYTTHYHANPLFTSARILEGYVEWAIRHVLSNDEGRLAWIIEVDGQDVGFSCVEIAADHSQARGVLNGTLPAYRGHGIYRRMLRAMLTHFAVEAVPRFVISTQARNVVVQRVWTAEGLVFERAESTIHINALLGDGAPEVTAANS